jgi:hypothetical protein
LLWAQKDRSDHLARLEKAAASYDSAAGALGTLVEDNPSAHRPGDPRQLGPAHYPEELGKICYDWACLDSVYLEALKEANLEPGERDRQIERHTRHALEQLRKAWTLWLKDSRDFPDPIAQLKGDSDLKALRAHAEFDHLLGQFHKDLTSIHIPAVP